MHVVQHAHLAHLNVAGEMRVAAADGQRGLNAFEVWVRTLEPAAHTEMLSHAGELVVLALAGNGKLLIDGGPLRFAGPCTLVIPPGQAFQLANNSVLPLQLVWVFTRAPVVV